VIDTHAHLESEEAPALLERARGAGVGRVIAVATSIEGCREALALSEANGGLYASLGIHPHEAGGAEAARLDELDELLAGGRAVAVGETGLDYFRDYAPREAQLRLFEAQLSLAAAHGLPVVIHSREADADTLAALAGFEGTVVCHCFSSPGMLATVLERGYYVSFAGNLTFPNASPLRDAARLCPPERLLLETDSPYLSPVPLRGRRNEPAYVMHTLDALAQARGEEAAALGARIDANADAAFAL